MNSARARVARYLLGGLVIGVFWYLNRHRSPVQDAIRTVVVFAIVMAILRVRLRSRIKVHLAPLIGTKAALVIIAAVIEQSVRHSTPHAALDVSVGLFVTVVLVGIAGDRFFFTPVAQVVAGDRDAEGFDAH